MLIQKREVVMDKEKIVLFLDLLEVKRGDWLVAFAEAGREAFGVRGDVVDVLEVLGIPHSDAEVIFSHLPADPAVLSAYLRPRLLGTRD
jgi:hypothetical protein